MRPKLRLKITDAVAACKFAHKVRHDVIAHRNADMAMSVTPMPTSSRAQLKKAIAALDDVFDLVHGYYTDEEPMIWDHLDALGGSESVLWIVRRGLAAKVTTTRTTGRQCDFQTDSEPAEATLRRAVH